MDVNAGLAMKGTRIAVSRDTSDYLSSVDNLIALQCDYFLKQQSPGLVVVTGSVAAQVTSVKT